MGWLVDWMNVRPNSLIAIFALERSCYGLEHDSIRSGPVLGFGLDSDTTGPGLGPDLGFH